MDVTAGSANGASGRGKWLSPQILQTVYPRQENYRQSLITKLSVQIQSYDFPPPNAKQFQQKVCKYNAYLRQNHSGLTTIYKLPNSENTQ